MTTAILPYGWRERVVTFAPASAEPSRARCLEPHDLVVSKLMAGRAKDLEFAWALIEAGLVSTKVLIERVETLEPGPARSRAMGTIAGFERTLKPEEGIRTGNGSGGG